MGRDPQNIAGDLTAAYSLVVRNSYAIGASSSCHAMQLDPPEIGLQGSLMGLGFPP